MPFGYCRTKVILAWTAVYCLVGHQGILNKDDVRAAYDVCGPLRKENDTESHH